jgi:hypothetical protein
MNPGRCRKTPIGHNAIMSKARMVEVGRNPGVENRSVLARTQGSRGRQPWAISRHPSGRLRLL